MRSCHQAFRPSAKGAILRIRYGKYCYHQYHHYDGHHTILFVAIIITTSKIVICITYNPSLLPTTPTTKAITPKVVNTWYQTLNAGTTLQADCDINGLTLFLLEARSTLSSCVFDCSAALPMASETSPGGSQITVPTFTAFRSGT